MTSTQLSVAPATGAGLLSAMPTPAREYVVWKDEDKRVIARAAAEKAVQAVPPYRQRKGFVPRKIADFGDGGAFPEIHVAQYPLGMGTKEETAASSGSIVPLEVDEKGDVKYDAIVKQGSNRSKKVFTSLDDMKTKEGADADLALPSSAAEEEAAERTRAALGVILDGKIASSKPTHIPEACDGAIATKAQFVRYTPNSSAPGYSASASQRIVKLVEQQVDPMEPPKHKHTKVPAGPPSPPVPILHSPPRKVTVADQQSWKIPPCISNWKNARGYTIPLDKRLAADGRGLQEVTVNNSFATLAEALYIAERSARDEVRARAQIRQANSAREKESQEQSLRELAQQARADRADIAEKRSAGDMMEGGDHHPQRRLPGQRREGGAADYFDDDAAGGAADDDDAPDAAHAAGRAEREQARIERKRERERQMRLDNAKGDMKRSRLERERERDVSEKVALGLLKGTAKLTGEQQFDKRLFNQSAGMDAGFGDEGEYNVYSKPLMDREQATAIYRPRDTEESKYGDGDAQFAALTGKSKFAAPDRGFAGTEGASAQQRDGPVQFERDAPLPPPPPPQEADPFGLDAFLDDVKGTKGK